MKKLNIAIVGLGNIGSYLFNYLKITRKLLLRKITVYRLLNMYLQDLEIKKKY